MPLRGFIPLENITAMAKSVDEDSIEYNFEYPKKLIPKNAEFFEFTGYDRLWADFYAKVASKTSLDYGRPRTKKERWIDNFYGLLGEKMVKDKLRNELNVLYTYNEREPRFFEKIGKEPFDFAIPTKNGEYFTLEIKTTKEPRNHRNMIIREGEWKKSDYALAVKMLSLSMDLEKQMKIFGFIAGYLTKKQVSILRVRENEYPCPHYPCRAKKLIEIPTPIPELWKKINSEGIHPVLER